MDEAEIRYGKGVKDAKHDTARKLKAMNVMSIEQIAEATGLKVKEIESVFYQFQALGTIKGKLVI